MRSQTTTRRTSTLDTLPTLSTYGLPQNIKRYDGIQKSTTSWDSLRHDPELWSQTSSSEDCVTIHFHAPLTSRRGPSLRIPLKKVEQTNSTYLLKECLHRPDAPTSPTISDDDGSDSGYAGSQASNEGPQPRYAELYIPAPAYATRKEAHLYHLGTRNFFAYLLDIPLVGESLGIALTESWKRIQAWQDTSEIAASDFKIYCQEQGYLSFAENADYALAALCLAEKTRQKEYWKEAFVHCVGMYGKLEKSEELAGVSSKTMMLVDRAAHEMDIHIRLVTRSLGSFLEEDLGPCQLGLSKALRDHLDRFRSTLHAFYVQQINGYFPPERDCPWDSRLWHGMRRDFQCLYAYLADEASSDDPANNRGAIGGICVMQNLQAFDERHDFVPLPHPLPLLPEQPLSQPRPTERRRSLGSFRIGRSGTPVEQKLSPSQLLSKASNTYDAEILENQLVQEYIRFERLKMEERTTIVEARKVRWLLVYSALQMLISITKAPSNVPQTTGLSYPLCIPEANFATPHWMEDEIVWQPRPESEAQSPIEPVTALKTVEFTAFSIQPDCEAESADQYFSVQNSIMRTDSEMSVSSMPSSPLRRTSAISRTASIRSGVGSLRRSMVGSLSRKNSQKKCSLSLSTWKTPSVFETLIELQSCAGDDDAEDVSPVESTSSMSMDLSPTEQTWVSTSEGYEQSCDIPTLEMHQLSIVGDDHDGVVADLLHEEPRDTCHPGWASSPTLIETLASDFSINDGFSESIASQPDLAKFKFDIAEHSYTRKRQLPLAHNTTQLAAAKRNKRMSVHAGSYNPARTFKSFPSHATGPESPYSSDSCASSVYSESGGQAAEIEEEESRGRRRIRRYSTFGVIDEQIQESVNSLVRAC